VMKADKIVSIVIPAYNEEDRLAETLQYLNFSWIKEIILVDDGSTDGTARIASTFSGVNVINNKENRGKGKAVERGIQSSAGKIIAVIDADLGESVREIDKLVVPVITGGAEITIASLPIRGGGLGLVRKLARYGLKVLTGQEMNSPLSGQRVFQRQILDKIMPFQDGFGLEIAMDIAIIRNNLNYQEIECNISHRITGQNLKGYLHRGRQFLDILGTLLKYRVDLHTP